jgi:hypothetical protein
LLGWAVASSVATSFLITGLLSPPFRKLAQTK